MHGIDKLRRAFPLGESWSAPETVFDTIRIADLEVTRAGFVTRDAQAREAVGSAASVGDSAGARAYFELVERTVTMEAMDQREADWDLLDAGGNVARVVPGSQLFLESDDSRRWQYSRSNGVAFHTDPGEARLRAACELIERDRVLRSWYGLIVPEKNELPTLPYLAALAHVYDWQAYVLPEPRPSGAWASDVRVAVIVGFPRRPGVPLARGFAGRLRAREALEAAASEALQNVAFLWGEAVPSDEPAVEAAPMTHLEWFLWPRSHSLLRDWLDGGHARYGLDWAGGSSPCADILFADLTPARLVGRASVVKATCFDALPLIFGTGAPELSRHLPSERRIHPIA